MLLGDQRMGCKLDMTREERAGIKPPGKAPGQIDENLRRVYREMVEEQVPDRFQKLIEQLRKQDEQS